MKKQNLIIAILILLNCQFSFAQQYKLQLDKLNNYLKTINDGYYGYFEVNGNDIYLRLQSGKYCKATITDLDKAYPEVENKSVFLKCKNGANCMTATYTSSNTIGIIMSNTTNINTTEFAQLINDFLSAVRSTNPAASLQTQASSTSNTENKITPSIVAETNKTASANKNKNDEDFDALEKIAVDVNKNMKLANNVIIPTGTRVKLINVFEKNDNYNEAKKYFGKIGTTLTDMKFAGDSYTYGKVKFEDGKELYFSNAVLEATPLINTTLQVQDNLQKLNQILKTLDGGAYSLAEIIDRTLFIRRKEGSSISIKLQDISNVGLPYKPSDMNWVRLFCKDGKECVNYIDKTGTYKSADDYGFFATSVSKTIELLNVLNDLIESVQQKATSVVKKAGTFADCKFILTEDCQNYFMQSTINDLRSQFTLRENSAEFYKGDGFEVSVEPSSGGILEVKFYKSFGKKPSNNIKWGEGISKVQEKYGQGKYSRFTQEYLNYPGIELEFWNGDLSFITFKRERTTSELLAYNIRQVKEYEAKTKTELAEATIQALKTPEQKAKEIADAKVRKEEQMQTDYEQLLDQLEAKIREGERIINSEKTAIAAGGIFKKAVENKLDKVRESGISLVDSFSKKYQGMIPSWMVKGILDKWQNGAVIK